MEILELIKPKTQSLTEAYKQLISCPIYITKSIGETSEEFEAMYDDYDSGLCLEVSGSVSWDEYQEEEVNGGETFYDAFFNGVTFWKDEVKIKLSKKMQKEILSTITFES